MPEAQKDPHNLASIVAQVVSMGPDAYRDEDKFPSGPRCAVDDFIVFRSYSGTRLKVHGHEYRLVNDDTVEAVVEDPNSVERA